MIEHRRFWCYIETILNPPADRSIAPLKIFLGPLNWVMYISLHQADHVVLIAVRDKAGIAVNATCHIARALCSNPRSLAEHSLFSLPIYRQTYNQHINDEKFLLFRL